MTSVKMVEQDQVIVNPAVTVLGRNGLGRRVSQYYGGENLLN